MYNLRIYPYLMGSQGAKDLSELLECKRVRDAGRYTPKVGQTILNWGNRRTPSWLSTASTRRVRILNTPEAVNRASNKLTTLRVLDEAGISTPEYTTDLTEAHAWLHDGERVIERHELRGSSGAGIRVVSLDDEDTEGTLQRAPLYTKYIPKSAEYRIHIFNGRMLDYVQKKRVASERRDDTYSPYIASMERGWVFTRTDVPESPAAISLAQRAITALGLDFGAVDIIYSEGRYYVLEVNTAPGLAGNTLIKYGNALRRLMGVGDLPENVTRRIMDQVAPPTPPPIVARPIAARPSTPVESASVNLRRQLRLAMNGQSDEVILRLNRTTAQKLRSLLLSL